MGDLFLLSEGQMARISPFFPLAHGVPRVDDRRVVSGIRKVLAGRGHVIVDGLLSNVGPRSGGNTGRGNGGAGAPATIGASIEALAKGGHVLVISLFGGEIAASLPLLPLKAMTLQGCYVGALEELKELVALVQARRLRLLPPLCRPRVKVESALHDIELARVAGRIVLTPE